VEIHPDDLIQLGTNYTEDEATLNNDRQFFLLFIQKINSFVFWKIELLLKPLNVFDCL